MVQEADFDIVHLNRVSSSTYDAEAIKLVTEILGKIENFCKF